MIEGGNWWRANEIVIRHLTRRLATHYRCRDKALVGCTWRRAIRESKAQRLWPRPMPRIPAFRRSALSVRFIFLAISGRGVRAFECALSSRTSSLVHGVRWAEVFFFGTDCCSGKGSRLRATPVAWSTHASKRIPHLATPLRWPLTWPRTPACRFRGSVRGSAASINRNGEVSEHRASDHPASRNTGARELPSDVALAAPSQLGDLAVSGTAASASNRWINRSNR